MSTEETLSAVLELAAIMDDASRNEKEVILKVLSKFFGFKIELKYMR